MASIFTHKQTMTTAKTNKQTNKKQNKTKQTTKTNTIVKASRLLVFSYTTHFLPCLGEFLRSQYEIDLGIFFPRGIMSRNNFMTSQSFVVSWFWSRGFAPQQKKNFTVLVHQDTGKKNHYRFLILLYVSEYCGEFFEQIKEICNIHFNVTVRYCK